MTIEVSVTPCGVDENGDRLVAVGAKVLGKFKVQQMRIEDLVEGVERVWFMDRRHWGETADGLFDALENKHARGETHWSQSETLARVVKLHDVEGFWGMECPPCLYDTDGQHAQFCAYSRPGVE